MKDPRKFKYSVMLEWTGEVEVEPEDDDDDESLRDAALELAIDEALSSPAAYVVYDSEIAEVTT